MKPLKEVQIQYCALFREQRGMSSESRSTSAATLRELYAELQREFAFSLPLERVRVAVSDEFCDWDRQLRPGDSIVFIPPVAGG